MAIFSRKETYVGLDIGTSSIKLVELQKDGKDAIRLVTYASTKGVQSLAEGNSNDAISRIATITREMFRKAGVNSQGVVAALPSLSVFSTVLSMPQMNEKELEKAVLYSAKNYVPSPLKDVVLGWTVINAGEKKEANEEVSEGGRKESGGECEIFLTAAPKDLVQRYSAVVDRLNANLIALEIESFPLSRSLLKNQKEPALLVDIGDLATNFSIVEDGYLRLNQSTNIGGFAMTDALAAKLGVNHDQAEEKKFEQGLQVIGNDETISSAMRPVVRDLIERSINLQRIFERKSGQNVRKVILIGGGAKMKGLPEFWKEVSGIPSEVGNPWKGIRVPAILNEKLLALGPSFSVAVGLALREFEQSV